GSGAPPRRPRPAAQAPARCQAPKCSGAISIVHQVSDSVGVRHRNTLGAIPNFIRCLTPSVSDTEADRDHFDRTAAGPGESRPQALLGPPQRPVPQSPSPIFPCSATFLPRILIK